MRPVASLGITRQAAVLLAVLAIAFGVSGCKKSEPQQTAAPVVGAPAAPGATPAPPVPTPPAVPEPAMPNPEPAPTTAAGPVPPTATVGVSKAPATTRSKGLPVLRAVRSATQPGFDRLVFEFDRAGLPAWQVEYVERPVVDCGSGEPVRVAGNAWLQVRFTGAQSRTEDGKATGGPRRRKLVHTVTRELVRTCNFEGEVTFVVGVARANPYTPRVMTEPSRFVIDIAH